jgi:hypothetical protein
MKMGGEYLLTKPPRGLQSPRMILSSFSSEPYGGDTDVRTTYCAFAISSMLDDWSGVRIEPGLRFIAACRVSGLTRSHMYLTDGRSSLMKAGTARCLSLRLQVDHVATPILGSNDCRGSYILRVSVDLPCW